MNGNKAIPFATKYKNENIYNNQILKNLIRNSS